MLIEAVRLRGPAAVGVNVTLMVQLPPPATLVPQVLVWENSPAFVPEIAMLEMASATTPGLESVTGCGALDVFTN